MSLDSSVRRGWTRMAICCISSDVSALNRLKKTPDIRFSSSPWRSSATIVLPKVGFFGFFTIASISAREQAIAASNAGS